MQFNVRKIYILLNLFRMGPQGPSPPACRPDSAGFWGLPDGALGMTGVTQPDSGAPPGWGLVGMTGVSLARIKL